MNWIKEKQIEDGYYWYRFTDGIAEPVKVQTRFGQQLMIDFSGQRSETQRLTGEFYGPITPPEFNVE